MNSEKEIITIVVFANRKDFCLTKICISSIRFYYPEIEILLVKDRLNGRFNTNRLCKALNVQVLDMGRKYYGWGAAKIHFILNKTIPQKRYLCLDSDIIFVGRILDKIALIPTAFVVNPDWQNPPFNKEVAALYIDVNKVKTYYPDYVYPGYFFNSGQFIATPGIINKAVFSGSFDPDRYPFYKNRDAFSLVDQAVLNAVLPVFSRSENIEIGTVNFMLWSVSFFEDKTNNNFEKFKDGKTPFMIHYAGDVRTEKLEQMKGADLLQTFRQQYYLKLSPLSKRLDVIQDKVTAVNTITRVLYKRNRIWIEILNRLKMTRYYSML